MGFGEVVSFSIMKVSECVSVLTLISWDKNTECLGHCQIIFRFLDFRTLGEGQNKSPLIY